VGDGRDARVGVGREVDAGLLAREREQRADKARVLVRVAVVLLPPERARLDVVERARRRPPARLLARLDEFRVLLDHARHDAEEGLVRREEAGPAGDGVTL